MKKWMKMLTVFALAVCAVMLVNVQSAKASIKSTNGLWDINADYFENTCEIVDYYGDDKDLVIPSKVDGLKVTKVNFYHCSQSVRDLVETVTLPNTVTEIYGSGFINWYKMKSIKLSEKLETIGDNAFARCSALRSITIPESVTKMSYRIFSDCTSLKKAVINGNPTIDEYTFNNCTSLTEVSMPKLTVGGRGMFFGCTSLKKVSAPKIEIIGNQMFFGCTSLKTFKTNKLLRAIGNEAFIDTSLETFNMPSSLTSLGSYAFDKSKMSTIIIPTTLTHNTVDIGSSLENADIICLNPYVYLEDLSQTYTVYGLKDSYAYESAKNQGIRFVTMKGITSAKVEKKGTASSLSWKKVSGVKKYTIYRYNWGEKSWQKIATTKTNKYTDKSKLASTKYKVTYEYEYKGKTVVGCIEVQLN